MSITVVVENNIYFDNQPIVTITKYVFDIEIQLYLRPEPENWPLFSDSRPWYAKKTNNMVLSHMFTDYILVFLSHTYIMTDI